MKDKEVITLNLILTQLKSVLPVIGKEVAQDFLKEITAYMKHLSSKDFENFSTTDRFTFDRFEGSLAIFENRKTGEMFEISKDFIDSATSQRYYFSF